MNPITCVLNGEALLTPPVWIMRQAGRYLPEYRALREKAGSFWALCENPELAAEATLMPVRRFGLDAAIVFSDILTIPQALGLTVRFSAEGPSIEPVTDFSRLCWDETGKVVLNPVYQALSLVRQKLDSSIALFGFAGAPWTLASYMVAGRGGDEQKAAKLMAYSDQVAFDRLLGVLTQAIAAHLVWQLQSGADVVQIFDSWAGGLSEVLFERCVLEPTKKVVTFVKDKIPEAKIVGFPRGTTLEGYRRYADETGIDAISLDTAVPPVWAAKNISLPVQGNLDPLALVTGKKTLETETERLLTAMKGRPFIFNLGHGIFPQTPVEHVEKLISLIRGF